MFDNTQLSYMQLKVRVQLKDHASRDYPWKNHFDLPRHIQELLWTHVSAWRSTAATTSDLWYLSSCQRRYQMVAVGDYPEGLEEVQRIAHEVSGDHVGE